MKKIIALFCACFLVLNMVDAFIPRSEAKIYDNVIRLHILADSNSDEAQSVKLLVRDAILEECGDLFSETGNVISAEKNLEENLSRVETIANRVLAENGMKYNAKAEYGYENYPTRVYENFTLPAGTYRSLRINLGKAEGNNWWCVLFPPLCTKTAKGDEDLSSAGINKKDTAVFTKSKYVFRFKFLELFR